MTTDALDQLFTEIERLIPLKDREACALRCALRDAAVAYGRAVRTETATYVQAIYGATR
ncbi:MAG TPA: hypothetical protein VN903_34955 [Polyangia bacterium]|nr:hypothetical protein [Polyangia bacterium]